MSFTADRNDIFGGAFLLDTSVHEDHRGVFLESYREDDLGLTFVQGNISVSRRNVVRGLHYQVRHPQGKFMRTVHGATFNVIVDLRDGSWSFGRAFATTLDTPTRGLSVPPGFANGFATLADDTVIVYEASSYYRSGDDRALFAFDPALSVPWPDGLPDRAIMSEKDRGAPRLDEAERVPGSEWA